MKMKNNTMLFAVLFLFTISGKAQDIFIPKMTNINPVSYTDVTYIGSKDTVLVGTYSGRIAKRIKGNPKEIPVAKIQDEVFSLAYHPKRKEIAAATLEHGILIINAVTGKTIKSLPLKTTWSIAVFFSEDCKYLVTQDQKGNQYIWDASKNYQVLPLPADFPKGTIIAINTQNIATVVSPNKVTYWDRNNNTVQKEVTVDLKKFADMDTEGNFLSLNYNECTKYNSNSHTVAFKVKHPNWITHDVEDYSKVYEDNYSMNLTTAKFARNKMYTASIDRSIRVWDKATGELLKTLSDHKATVHKLRIAKGEKQMVSIDLKGGIFFWDLD
ncbi:WD40 repeat domain-containing protein [Flavobacterium humi]|uniref:WD40 repeat domain-containing protein n=1 Tax=Flavobacterium humi TaxID=2562683 RepID=A0A4Z0LAD0_9FLAO|nr:WD40 repeat domain-containing protein [Flavobacterium humi]TGD58240.1 WD40 repeat domain-containing protein [Flavobacterium humi]